MSRFRLTPAQREMVVARYRAGDKRELVAAAFGLKPSTVSNIARKAGLAPRSSCRPLKVKGERRIALERDIKAGVKPQALAHEYGISARTVYLIRRRMR